MTDIVIFDLDGTLANIDHRKIHLQHENVLSEHWEKFFKECPNDTPYLTTINILKSVKKYNSSIKIHIWSGRSDLVLNETIEWLAKNDIPYDELKLRSKGDHKPDYVLKEEWFKDLIDCRVLGVFDDREEVISMFRKYGITTYLIKD